MHVLTASQKKANNHFEQLLNFLWSRGVAMLAYVLQILEWTGYTDMCEHECVQLFLAVKNSVASMVCSSLGYNRLIALQSWVL